MTEVIGAMVDVDELRKKLEDRLVGLSAGVAQKRVELARLETEVASIRDVINATGGAIQECRALIGLLSSKDPEPHYQTLPDLSSKVEDADPVDTASERSISRAAG